MQILVLIQDIQMCFTVACKNTTVSVGIIMVEQSNDQCSSLSCLFCSTPEYIELLHCALE